MALASKRSRFYFPIGLAVLAHVLFAQQQPVAPPPLPNSTAPSGSQPSASSPVSDSDTCGGFSITPQRARITPGGTLEFEAKPLKSNCLLPNLTWSIQPDTQELQSIVFSASKNNAHLTLAGTISQWTDDIKAHPTHAYMYVSAESTNQLAESVITVTTQPGGNIVIPVIGFEQAGASAAQSSQKFFFNFFVSRPVPRGNRGYVGQTEAEQLFGPRLRWWGDVRIASYPQQITSGVAEFATGFATQVGQLQVNKLAQAGEFNTGLETRLWSFPRGLYSIASSTGREHSQIGIVAGFGAISPLNPTESLQIFVTPPIGSPQRTAFLRQFPTSAGFTYTGFVTPDRGRFYWEYGAGIRFTTLFLNNAGTQTASPAMVSYSLGQNQLVSGGRSQGIVQRLEAFFPLPLGERFAENVTTIYLFGRTDMRLAAPQQTTPFILQLAPSSVNGFDSDVNVVTTRSNRDLYTIGVGVDAVKLIKTLTGQNKNKSNSSQTMQ